jgi:hypothetical protein
MNRQDRIFQSRLYSALRQVSGDRTKRGTRPFDESAPHHLASSDDELCELARDLLACGLDAAILPIVQRLSSRSKDPRWLTLLRALELPRPQRESASE